MIGSQEPRIRIEPERAGSDGPDAGLMMSEYAFTLDLWQQSVLDCWLGYDQNRNYNVTSAGLATPRQNGKNGILEALEFYCMTINGERFLHTAHQVKTAKKSFRRIEAIFTDKRHPEIMDLVRNIRYTNGEECIELENGGSVEFSARSRQAARGFDKISRVIYDEAQELTDDQVEATMATLSASDTGTRQIILTGTPPYPGCPGEVFRRRRIICLIDKGPFDAWHEWSVDAKSVDEIAVQDRKLWYFSNPAMGKRLTEEFTAEELRTLSKDGFCRERLGWWSPVLEQRTEYAIDKTVWDSCRSEEPKPEGKTAYGVKFTADGAEVCLCGAVIRADGSARISMISREQTGHGLKWLADFLNERYEKASCVVIDGRNGVDVLVEKISDTWRYKGSVIRPTAKEVIASVSVLTAALTEKTVDWFAGQEELRDSAITSVKRPIGGGWGFGGDNSGPIEAAALALWGAKTCKRDPNRKMRIG
jgi:hypothetical protein